ncbi:hypothetical protein THAR02_07706 [Trichoderma harzianum]|uniref:Uncharacterized protein n=1 Tax=Trichoderma harzianum TaxID=5544 RepID=A0A0F9ZIR1_TRIHA|nr:hypothetical protein THAR02_07706 [Trichoderma harzianum]
MKLIIVGASGFVATELISQALRRPDVTSLVALSRKPVTAPDGENAAKLKSVVIGDYGEYPDDVKKELAGANACIWYGSFSQLQSLPPAMTYGTVGITPPNLRKYPFEEVVRICQTSTLSGMKAFRETNPAPEFRFLYMGDPFEADSDKKPPFMLEYLQMRAETEEKVLAYARENKIDACVAKPGFMTGGPFNPLRTVLGLVFRLTPFGTLPVQTVAAAMLDQAVTGFEKEHLGIEDLKRIGTKAIEESGKR